MDIKSMPVFGGSVEIRTVARGSEYWMDGTLLGYFDCTGVWHSEVNPSATVVQGIDTFRATLNEAPNAAPISVPSCWPAHNPEDQLAALKQIEATLASQNPAPTDRSCTGDLDETLKSRGATHGDAEEQFELAQEIKELYRRQPNWVHLSRTQREGLDMHAVKTSRILVGNHNEPDHWLDGSGYFKCVHTVMTR